MRNQATRFVLGVSVLAMAWAATEAISQIVIDKRQAVLNQVGTALVVQASHGFVDRFVAAWEKPACNACDHDEDEPETRLAKR